jgi:aryl-alcohol dehydrogenase-like predicted oxidoreductase
MEKRTFGRTGHASTVAIFGAAAFYEISQEEADQTMERVIAAGVNHVDVAPGYGQAEERIGPWMARVREWFFLGCKTQQRTRADAAAELKRSLERLQVEDLDLYQLHAVTTMEELDLVTGPGGALEALVEARDRGLTRYLGITGHGLKAPRVFCEALRRFDFDTVLFPLNFVLYANPTYRREAEDLLAECRARDVGVMVIKAVARGPWGTRPRRHTTWYEPFDGAEMVQRCVDFSLSQDVTGLCTVADVDVLLLFLDACERFAPLDAEQQEALVAEANDYEPLFV